MTDVQTGSLVYFVRIGKFVKIGFTTNLPGRLKAFLTSATDLQVLCTIPGGDRALEKRLHRLLGESRVQREMFHQEFRLHRFIDLFEGHGLEVALNFLEESSPEERARKKEEERQRRVKVARQTKAEKDAYFAKLVADRKSRIGW